jgi:hypothetical protein
MLQNMKNELSGKQFFKLKQAFHLMKVLKIKIKWKKKKKEVRKEKNKKLKKLTLKNKRDEDRLH